MLLCKKKKKEKITGEKVPTKHEDYSASTGDQEGKGSLPDESSLIFRRGKGWWSNWV